MAIPRFKLVSGNANIQNVPEAATMTFLAGDLVYMTSDTVTVCTGASQGAVGIFGVAAANASGTTAAKVPVYVVTPEQQWRAFPATTKKPTTAFDIGVDYHLSQTAVGKGVLGGAGADAVVVNFDYGGCDGTVAGDPVIIRFDHAACQGILG